MRILLPPSEAKRPTGTKRRGRAHAASEPQSQTAFDHPRLAAARRQVATALVEFCGGDPTIAARALALPERSAAVDLETNQGVLDALTVPALDRYAGVIYDALDVAALTATGRKRALESVLIFSGLFGVLRADELIPAYRLPVAAVVPPIGPLTPFWRRELHQEVSALLDDGLVIDLRSSDYSPMWRAIGSTRDRVVSVRMLCESPRGGLAVISYPSKYGKGLLTRALVSSRARISTAADVASLWMRAGGRDAIVRPGGVDLVTVNSAMS